MPDLDKFSDEELKAELNKRAEKLLGVPTPQQHMDWRPLVRMTNLMIEQALKDQYWDEDNDHYIFEEVMKTIYGENFFVGWYNKQKWCQ